MNEPPDLIRKSPHNLDAEKSALGSVFIKPAVLDMMVATLAPDDFFLPAHREIFDAMIAVAKRDRAVDPVAVADELRVRGHMARISEGAVYLTDLWNGVPTAENAAHYARIVQEKAILRRMIAACADIQSTAYGDFGEFEAFIHGAVQQIAGVAMRDTAVSETVDELGMRIIDNLERAERGELVQKIPTGITKLDELLEGGMGRGHLVVPCGLTSMGKSSWGVQVAFRGARDRGIPAIIFSLEQPREEILIKGAASLARLDTGKWNVRPGGVVDWKAINRAMSTVSQLSHLIRIEEDREIGKIVAKTTAWRSTLPDPNGPAMAFVDHIQKVAGVRTKSSNRQEEVWSVASALKNLAKDLAMPVVAPAQLDNDAAKEKRAPRIGDIRDSKAIEHEADLVIGIHRDRMPKQLPDDSLDYNSECELIALKHRGGRVGKRTVRWMGAWQGFEDRDADYDT
jgi:replicative DNA helicase